MSTATRNQRLSCYLCHGITLDRCESCGLLTCNACLRWAPSGEGPQRVCEPCLLRAAKETT